MQTLVDDKCKQLGKNLPTAQRDQMFFKLTKDEFKMKKAIVANLKESATQANKAMDKIVEFISSLSKQ